MPDVHVDSMIFQYPFFWFGFFVWFFFFSFVSLYFFLRLTVCLRSAAFWFFDLIVFIFFLCELELVLEPHQPDKVLKNRRQSVFVFSGDEFPLF